MSTTTNYTAEQYSLKINGLENLPQINETKSNRVDELTNMILNELKINQLFPNAQLKTAIQYVSTVFQQCKFPSNDYHTKGIKDVCFWTCLCFPELDSTTLNLYSLIMSYLSVVDDACDSEKDIDGFLRAELQTHINCLNNNEKCTNQQSNPSIELARFIISQIKSVFNCEQSNYLIQGMVEFYEHSYQIASMWANDQHPTLEQYIQLREYDSLTDMLLKLKLVTNMPSLNLGLSRYFQLCCHLSSMINDICSLPKDLHSSISNNYVLLLNNQTVNMEYALTNCIEVLKEMKSLEHTECEQYHDLESMKSIARGYVGWCFKSPRFQHANHYISCLLKDNSGVSSSSCITTQRKEDTPITYLDVIMRRQAFTREVKSTTTTTTPSSGEVVVDLKSPISPGRNTAI